jgi:hypothetical protein
MATTELSDGTIIPSHLGIRSSGYAGDTGVQSDWYLRSGEVKQIVYPDDPTSLSKTQIEYHVLAQKYEGSRTSAMHMYHNVIVVNVLGGVADRTKYTLRPASTQQAKDNVVGDGSKVLLLCINGQTPYAVILGGLRVFQDQFPGVTGEPPDKKSDGHNYFTQFNGGQLTVNKDGEIQITFNGATNTDGTLADSASEDAQGSNILFSKDGSITSTSPDGKQSIKINHDDHKVEVVADQEMTVNSSGNVNIQSTGVVVGAGTNAWLLATTYREAQTELHTQLLAQLEILATTLTVAGASLTAGGTAIVIPVVGSIIAGPLIATSGASVTSAVAAIEEMASAITIFESMSPEYLSLKNTND